MDWKNMVNEAPPFYQYTPDPVLESNHHLLYWDRTILTNKTVAYNRPDIVLINKQDNTAIIIDITVPLTHNILKSLKTEMEKITKYEAQPYFHRTCCHIRRGVKVNLSQTWKR
uniref:Uncharacterized protein n=1 Tax=Cacopsylla melanoneura TaxID=428564 RepID=A0A8D8SNB9_9HEMI